MQFLKQFFDGNERDIQKYQKVVQKVNALESETKALSDSQLQAKTTEFKGRVQTIIDQECEKREKTWEELTRDEKRTITDLALDPILPEAFAVAREAAARTIKMRPFDVQLMGGMVLHDGRIAEMKTGEGKTLTATLPLYLNALTGHGVHLVTVNDYLSKVGAVAMGPLYQFLGLTVGIIQSRDGDPFGGSYIYDSEYRHPDPRYDFARPVETRRESYDCDITYGTNSEYGFDYLFDNLAVPGQPLNQREMVFAIVDEVDSILIDEARTPLIISGQAESAGDLYVKMDRIIRQLQADRDYKLEEKQKTAVLSEEGQQRVEAALSIQNLSDAENISLMQHAIAALKAHAVYKRDVDYLVKKNEEGRDQVVLIDENTGRLMFGRRLSDGLHQAIEAKEGVKIENENRTTATITYQNLFRLYPKLGGMTGTAKTEEDEFRKIYALDVVVVPTNKPMIRKDQADVIFKSEEAKLRGIVREIIELFARQQPVLVGTRSVEMSERVSDRLRFDRLELLGLIDLLRDRMDKDKKLDKAQYAAWSTLLNQKLTTLTSGKLTEIARHYEVPTTLKDKRNVQALAALLGVDQANISYLEEAMTHGIPHNILNAKSHEKEARIISEAGRKGSVTIATNMAGRGVDILLGGSLVNETEEETQDEDAYEYRRGGKPIIGLTPVGERGSVEHEREANAVRDLGGLFIIGSERHESRRIDNQLRGRSGRQGDPGASRFYISFEDELMRLFGDKSNNPLLVNWPEDQSIDTKLLSKMIERAQKKVEMHYFDMRKHTLDYDDVMNVQREKIYEERRRIMQGADLRETIVDYLRAAVTGDLNLYAPAGAAFEEWDLDGLFTSMNQIFPLYLSIQEALETSPDTVIAHGEEDGQGDVTASTILKYFPSLDAGTVRDTQGWNRDELVEMLTTVAEQSYADKEQHFMEVLGEENGLLEMRGFERHQTLRSLDQHWMEHLSNMDYLREGIGWRGYAGIDPLVLYKKEAYDMFQQMLASVQEEVVRVISFVQISLGPPSDQRRPRNPITGEDTDDAESLGSGISRADRRRTAKGKSRTRR